MQRTYELVLIVSPEVQEEAVTAVVERVDRFITDRGGTVENHDLWGRRRLAYPIKRFAEGNYILTNLQLEPAAAADLETQIRINEDILRHLLVRRD